MMKLVEIFYSLQGEGLMAGSPSIFVRFGGCNFSCVGFGCESVSPLDESVVMGCDTIRAVDVKHFSSTWENVDAAELIRKFEQFQESLGLTFLPHVVITGGEPLLTMKSDEFDLFGNYLVDKGYCVTVETNGSIDIDFEQKAYAKTYHFALAVKLSSSGEPLKKRVVDDVLKKISSQGKSFFKFVINPEMLESEIKEIKEVTQNFQDTPVFCMPQGGSKIELEKNSKDVFLACTQEGWRYSDRLHIRIFDKKERV